LKNLSQVVIVLGGAVFFAACGGGNPEVDAGNAVVADAAVATPLDAGTSEDAGSAQDAGATDAGSDAGFPVSLDAGSCESVTWAAPANCAATDLLGKLNCVPGLVAVQLPDSGIPGYERFNIVLEQPVDHANPSAGKFGMRMQLLHTSDTKPMVMFTSGYNLATGRSEPTRTFRTNQISYEHRYFASSRPVPTDWTKLNIEQAAGDAHHIAEALHWLYPAKWVNTGGSKGGMTSVYQRRFHPCDVDATVAYVAPVSFGEADPIYVPFLESVGGDTWASCRANIIEFQKRLLMQREQITPLVMGSFVRIGVDQAFELAVQELPFAFWQYTYPRSNLKGCALIPTADATPKDMLDFLESHSSADDLIGNSSYALYEPYYYQAATQLGTPATNEVPLAGLLRFPGTDISTTFLPLDRVVVPDRTAMPDVNQWLATNGERMMLVYGEFDPWSSRTFELGQARDSFKFFEPGGNHGARIGTLSPTDKALAISTLERWLKTPLVVQPTKKADPEEEPLIRVPR
jgi:PS-10 peptidase S37